MPIGIVEKLPLVCRPACTMTTVGESLQELCVDGGKVRLPTPPQQACQYLRKHRHRIINYDYFQAEQLCSIGSGAVKSAIKQIYRRLQISGTSVEQRKCPSNASPSLASPR